MTTANPLQGIDVAGLLGIISPGNCCSFTFYSCTKSVTDGKIDGNTAQTSEKSKEETKKPSQNVSDGSRET
ncbi:MAG: hypothetical protein IPO32_13130 [Crocinitomicaceae bacterium]|nr:hypothetical protein [Crocinitomicaceae bacterium]